MKKIITSIYFLALVIHSFAQKNVQTLQPTRLSIFKNGTYFIKKSSRVDVVNKRFTIPTPTNALMGSYWIATSKDAVIKTIVIKQDSIMVERKCLTIKDYLKASINKKVTMRKDYLNAEILEGVLLDFDEISSVFKIKTNNNKIVVANADNYKELVINEGYNYNVFDMNVANYSTIELAQNKSSITATSLSLENGIQWFPSYLLTIINDNEASLAMKATILNNDESFANTDVDIIIGNPEMFYGKTLDPICTKYLNTELLNYRDNGSARQMQSFANSASINTYIAESRDGNDDDINIEGNKLEDLFIYKLGKQTLEKNATEIIPVVNSTLKYEDIYTADLPVTNSASAKEEVINVFHKYRISNNSTAPLTTGSVLVLSKDELPMAQSELRYTPINGKRDINIAKAIDIQLKNDEVEIKREKVSQKETDYRYKINYNGKIKVANFQNKKIKLFLTKVIVGEVITASNSGKYKIVKLKDTNENQSTIIEWEVELNAGQKLEVNYNFFVLNRY